MRVDAYRLFITGDCQQILVLSNVCVAHTVVSVYKIRIELQGDVGDSRDGGLEKKQDSGFQKIVLLKVFRKPDKQHEYHEDGEQKDGGDHELHHRLFKKNENKKDDHAQIDGPETEIFQQGDRVPRISLQMGKDDGHGDQG